MNKKLSDLDLLPREKLEMKGVENLKDHELLSILLRTGRKNHNVFQVAQDILKKYSLEKLLDLDIKTLKEIKGIGSSKACILIAAFELSKRALHKGLGVLQAIKSPKDILPFLVSIQNAKKEHFIAIYLNSRKQVILQETISIGSVDGSLVHPREVLQPAVECSASSIILAHNHPSGNVSPSREDYQVTKRLCQSASIIGIEILDHIIISKDNYISMREEDKANEIGFLENV